MSTATNAESNHGYASLLALMGVFLRLSFTAWCGPAWFIPALENELVKKREWISGVKFQDIKATAYLMPGADCIKISYMVARELAGMVGAMFCVGAVLFPGVSIAILATYIYAELAIPALIGFFIGTQPVVTALIVHGACYFGRQVLTKTSLYATAAIALLLYMMNIAPIVCLIIAGVIALANRHTNRKKLLTLLAVCVSVLLYLNSNLLDTISRANIMPEYGHVLIHDKITPEIIKTALEAGLLSFGGTYSQMAWLMESAVNEYAWIDTHSFNDGIAMFTIVPASWSAISGFIGFMAGGLPGALIMLALSTMPIVLLLLLGGRRLMEWCNKEGIKSFLEGVVAGSFGLFLVMVFEIMLVSIPNTLLACLFLVSLVIFFRAKSAWVIPATMIVASLIGFVF